MLMRYIRVKSNHLGLLLIEIYFVVVAIFYSQQCGCGWRRVEGGAGWGGWRSLFLFGLCSPSGQQRRGDEGRFFSCF